MDHVQKHIAGCANHELSSSNRTCLSKPFEVFCLYHHAGRLLSMRCSLLIGRIALYTAIVSTAAYSH